MRLFKSESFLKMPAEVVYALTKSKKQKAKFKSLTSLKNYLVANAKVQFEV
jgi:hypothetical protein